MSDIDLHIFKEDLAKVAPKGRNVPPVSIRAKDLDGNYQKVSLLKGEGDPPLYEVEYTEEGTRITRVLPDGANPGDLLYYDGSEWNVFPAVTSADLHVLGIQNGTLQWVPTEACP